MPRKSSQPNEESDLEDVIPSIQNDQEKIDHLSQMLASILTYLSDEENEEIDISYIFDNTEGLRDWWNEYKENNRKLIEEEIRESLGELSLEELQKIHEQIKTGSERLS
ncbi:hypothetical protein ACOQFO_13885 [Ureibacillus sp. MALMAid1270]|uniref:hypothetical protein n=1 Tax=Ureibacillus sp. MALMAid1270 TaxID=3411629 RepID=UPI003BA8059F